MTDNILTDDLPEAIEVNGTVYDINSSYRDCLMIILAFEDPELTPIEKQIVLLRNLYIEQPKREDVAEAIRKGIKFLNGGKEEEVNDPDPVRIYSFQKDARLIYSAFRQTHGIDLQKERNLHWWTFLSLFMDLGSETVFCNLLGLRKRVKSGKATKEEKALSQELGDIYEVPDADTRTLEEKEKDREFDQIYQEARKRKKEERERKRNKT